MDIYTAEVNADKMLCVIMACNQRVVIKAIWMGVGLFPRRLCGTTHDTKDVSKATDTQYKASPTYFYGFRWTPVFLDEHIDHTVSYLLPGWLFKASRAISSTYESKGKKLNINFKNEKKSVF